MPRSELARYCKEREERVRRAYARGEATAYEAQYWACLTALAAYRDEVGGVPHRALLRRVTPPRRG